MWLGIAVGLYDGRGKKKIVQILSTGGVVVQSDAPARRMAVGRTPQTPLALGYATAT